MSASDENRTVLITGASRGLGRAMVREFTTRGWNVIGCARSADALETLSQEIGEGHLLSACDVLDDSAVSDFAEKAASQIGVPDLVLNNAALINRNAPLWEVSADEFDRVIDVNLKGVQNVIRHFVPLMIERGSGVVVNFSSGWGRSTSPDVAPYCCTKWGIEGLSRGLADDLPPGLASIALNPGIIDTDMLRQSFGESAGMYPSPEDWARTAVPFFVDLDASDNGAALSAP